jgi:site-specific DNA-cytosine methylase
MGNQTYGISRWLAELGLVNSWGVDDQWENKLSRVRKRKDKDIDRLKALGNAVVPQFMELVGRLIIKSLVEDTLVFDENIIKKTKKK